MNIETFNQQLTAGLPVLIKSAQSPPLTIHHHHIARIQRYYEINGAPTEIDVDDQNKRVQGNCKTVK